MQLVYQNFLSRLVSEASPDAIEIEAGAFGSFWVQYAPKGKPRFRKQFFDAALTENFYRDFAVSVATASGQTFNGLILLCVTPLEGHRVTLAMGNITKTGITLAIRLARSVKFTLADYTINKNALKAIQLAVSNGKSLLVCSSTSSGKTTLLNALIALIPSDRKIITVENAFELKVDHPLTIPLLRAYGNDRITFALINDLINRSTPDGVIFGELDTQNTLPFLRSINLGQRNCMATLHSNASPSAAISAISTNLRLSGGLTGDEKVLEDYIKGMIHGFVFITRRDAVFQIDLHLESGGDYLEVK